MKIHRLSPIVIAILLSACGGSDDVTPTSSVTGKAVDGYLSGATVVCDSNDNGKVDSGEASTTTDSTGAYTLACDKGLILTGGTNIDTNLPFQGRLRAPAGSSVITPLTTLVASGISVAKVAEILGLPAGTDVTKVDPAVQSNGAYVNQEIFQKTLAVQQLIQQASEVIFAASVGGSASTSVGQAQYAEIAKAVATSLSSSSTPLIGAGSGGTVSSTVVNTLLTGAVGAIKATSDSDLATLKTAVANVDSARLANFATSGITAQANMLSAATGDALSAAAKVAQSDVVLNTVSESLRSSGAFGASSSVNITNAASATATAVANGIVDSTLISSLTSAGVTSPPAATTVNDYFSINSDTITLGAGTGSQQSYTLSQLKSGITLTGPSSTIDDFFNLSFGLTSNGTPISSVTAKLGFELAGTGTDKRIFRFIIDKVQLALSGGQVVATVPTNATLTAYARKVDGTSETTVTLTGLDDHIASSVAGTVNYSAKSIVTMILGQANSQSSSFFSKLIDSQGTFTLKGVLSSNVPIRTTDKHLLPVSDVTIGGKSVGGPSVSGTVTVN